MKTNRITHRFAVTIMAAAVSLGCLADAAKAQPSPVLVNAPYTWDMVLSGQRRGTAQVEFFSDLTLFGYQISALPPLKQPSVDLRTGMIENENSNLLNRTNIIGEAVLSGVWSFDLSQRVIGSYIEVFRVYDVGTNYFVTNAYTFRAQVNPGRGIILSAQGPSGRVTYRGHPTIPLANLTGDYYAYDIHDGLSFLEFFSLSPTAAPNIYDVIGTGPDYSYTGTALLVRQGQLSMVTGTEGSNTVVRTVTGGFKANAVPPRGNLSGQEGDVVGNVRFRINP